MQPNYPAPNGADYGFIMQDKPIQKKSPLPGGSMAHKILFICLGLFIFIILFSIIRGVVSPGADFSGFATIAQDQQALISVLEDASKKENLSTPTKEFTLIAHMTLVSDQQQNINYLAKNDAQIKPKDLNLKISSKTKTELAKAEANSLGAYESAYKEVVKSQLNSYQTDLRNTYKEFKGEKGRAVLDQSYTNSELLVKRLESK